MGEDGHGLVGGVVGLVGGVLGGHGPHGPKGLPPGLAKKEHEVENEDGNAQGAQAANGQGGGENDSSSVSRLASGSPPSSTSSSGNATLASKMVNMFASSASASTNPNVLLHAKIADPNIMLTQ